MRKWVLSIKSMQHFRCAFALVAFLATLCNAKKSDAQPTWDVGVDYFQSPLQTLTDVLSAHSQTDSGFVTFGRSIDTGGYLRSLIIQWNNKGELLNDTTLFFKPAHSPTLRDAITLSNGDVVVVGEIANVSAQKNGSLIALFTAQGQLQWFRDEYDSTRRMTYFDVVELSSGNLICTGYTEDPQSGPPYKPMIVGLDSNGNVRWRTIIQTWKGTLSGAELLNDSQFVVAGADHSAAAFPGKPTVLKMDTAGNLIWRYIHPYKRGHTNSIAVTDSGFVFGTTARIKDSFQLRTWAMVDHQGQFKWEQVRKVPRLVNHVVSVAVRNHQIISSSLETESKYQEFPAHTVLSSLDFNGEINWERRIISGDTTCEGSITVRLTVDDATGAITGSGSLLKKPWLSGLANPTQDGWFYQVDSLGCLKPGCDTIIPEDSIEHVSNVPELLAKSKAYPNPMESVLWVDVDLSESEVSPQQCQIFIYSINGQRVKPDVTIIREAESGQLRFEILRSPEIKNGVYHFVVASDDGWPIASGLFVAQ